jgi:predicted DNA-binding protein
MSLRVPMIRDNRVQFLSTNTSKNVAKAVRHVRCRIGMRYDAINKDFNR